MPYQILLFASLRDVVGQNKVALEMDEPILVADLLSELFKKYPQLLPFQNRFLVAVNHTYARADLRITHSDEIALFTPVSGG